MTALPFSAVLPSLAPSFELSLVAAAGLGFTHADVVALADRPAAHLEALADSGLVVACAYLGHGLPAGHGLDAGPAPVRRATLDLLTRQVADAAVLGATRAALAAGADGSDEGIRLYAEGFSLLAARAASRGVRLCLEPRPRCAPATAAAALGWLESSGPQGAGLLLDAARCPEGLAEVARRAGRRLAHVRVEVAPGPGGRALPALLSGEVRERLLPALEAGSYDGALALAFILS